MMRRESTASSRATAGASSLASSALVKASGNTTG